MSEDGDNNSRGGGNQQELATRQIQIQSKRFYLDVKENKRGRFIKFAEVGVGGRKSRIIMSMGAASEFKQHLTEFSDYHSSLGPSHGTENSNNKNNNNGGGNDEDGLLKSQTLVRDRKRYYLDLKENQRGRFLRISMVMQRGPRAQIAIPAQGLIEFKDHLAELLEQYGNGEEANSTTGGATGGSTGGASNVALPESKTLKADNKTFYFDCGSNPRGIFLRVSEVRPNRYRSSITVPEKFWDQFVGNMREFVDKIQQEKAASQTAAAEKSESK